MIDGCVIKLMQCFNRSFINAYGEFIAHEKSNTYFNVSNCENELEIKCKVIEWFSRPALKEGPYRDKKRNIEFRKFMRDGINKYLGTDFSEAELLPIYCKLGNNVDRELCVKFIESGYDMNVLKGE